MSCCPCSWKSAGHIKFLTPQEIQYIIYIYTYIPVYIYVLHLSCIQEMCPTHHISCVQKMGMKYHLSCFLLLSFRPSAYAKFTECVCHVSWLQEKCMKFCPILCQEMSMKYQNFLVQEMSIPYRKCELHILHFSRDFLAKEIQDFFQCI